MFRMSRMPRTSGITCGECKQYRPVYKFDFQRREYLCKTCHMDMQQKFTDKILSDIQSVSKRSKIKLDVITSNDIESNGEDKNQTEDGIINFDGNKDNYIYLLSAKERRMFSHYKIGRHTGKKSKLVSRYKTYFEDVDIIRFVTLPDNIRNHETAIHQLLKKWRVNKSEWYRLNLSDICKIFDEYVISVKLQQMVDANKTHNNQHLRKLTTELSNYMDIYNHEHIVATSLDPIKNTTVIDLTQDSDTEEL